MECHTTFSFPSCSMTSMKHAELKKECLVMKSDNPFYFPWCSMTSVKHLDQEGGFAY